MRYHHMGGIFNQNLTSPSSIFHTTVYPVIAHNIWTPSGFLNHDAAEPLLGIGMIDFAGSGVVHVTGGCTALIASYLLGPRSGRFFDESGEKLAEPVTFPGHSKSLQVRMACVVDCHLLIFLFHTSHLFSLHRYLDAGNLHLVGRMVRLQYRKRR